MRALVKVFLFAFLLLCEPACTVYTEKQSEALSKVVYASKDSIDAARIDLADQYATEATRIVKPPKTRIEIHSIVKNEPSNKSEQNKTINQLQTKKRIAIVPERYKNDHIIVAQTEEYQKLLADQEIYNQIRSDNEELSRAKKEVESELIRQAEYRDKMVKELNSLKRQIAEKNLALIRRNIIIVGLTSVIGFGAYFVAKGAIL